MFQRASDILICMTALMILSPILIVIVLILLLTGENQVFYRQIRIGKDGLEFKLIKFATMLLDSPNIGTKEITLKNDPRVLPFGRILRKTKMNEIPQLWNVIIGEMSIVGPRPMVPATFSLYDEYSRKQINLVKPGLTGIGSIIFRDEERYLSDLVNPVDFYIDKIIPYKSALEVWFVSNQSIAIYFKIIFVTAWVIISPKSKIANIFFKNLPDAPEFIE